MLARPEMPDRRPADNHEDARRDQQRRPPGPPRSSGAGDKSCCAAPWAQDHNVSKDLAVGAFKQI